VSALLLAAALALSARAEPVRLPPPAPSASDDEEVIRNLELLDRLDLLRHAELVDDGALSEGERPDPPGPPPERPPPPQPR
jgi:hypothetical protein